MSNELKNEIMKDFKWVVWWGQYSLVRIDNEYSKKVSVIDCRVYFNDGAISDLYQSDDEAMKAAETWFKMEHTK